MMAQADVNEMDVWLVNIKILSVSGYTLWLSNDDDILLAKHTKILLFRELSSLRAFILSGQECNISSSPIYRYIQELVILESSDLHNVLETSYIDFNLVSDLITEAKPSTWNTASRTNVLTCLNMLWDIANTVNDRWIIEQMKEGTKLADFMDTLTFSDNRSLDGMSKFDIDPINNSYNNIVQRISERIAYIAL